MMDIIKRLHKFETFQKGEGDEYGAEVLANAQKEITDLRAQLAEAQANINGVHLNLDARGISQNNNISMRIMELVDKLTAELKQAQD